MQFNFDEGGDVSHAMANVATARDEIKAAVDGLTPFARTPLSETLYEATLYFRGGHVDYGNVGPVRSVAASRVGNQPHAASYLSPITAACQKNFIVLLTDGEPFDDNDAFFKILDLPDFATLVGTDCDGTGDGHCLDDLAEYLFKADLEPQPRRRAERRHLHHRLRRGLAASCRQRPRAAAAAISWPTTPAASRRR